MVAVTDETAGLNVTVIVRDGLPHPLLLKIPPANVWSAT